MPGESILISLVSANGSRSGARLFQALASGGEPTTADWVGADGDEGPKQESKDGDQPQPQGWAGSEPRPSEVGRGYGKAHPEAGGRTAGSSSGLWLYMVRQHGAGRHTSHNVRRELGVEKTAGDQPASDHKPAADPHDELHSGRAGCEDAENSGGGGHAKVGAPGGLVHGSGHMALQALGPSQEGPSGGQDDSACPVRSGDHSEGDPGRHPGAGDIAQIPGIAAPDCGYGTDGRAPGSLLHNTGFGESPWGTPPSEPLEAVRQHGPEAAEESLASGEATQTRPRQTSGWTPTTSALYLKLRNVGNTCYINTLVQIISWLLERTASQVTCLGLGQHAWRAVLVQRKAFVVHNLFPWTFLMQGWSHGGRQHDICEFFSHLACRMQFTPFQGTWNARFLEAGRTCVHDSGDCINMLTLEVPTSGHWQLQDLVDGWWGQAFVHALESTPQWLAIRLNRFNQDGSSGEIRKMRTRMVWASELRVPTFADSTLEVVRARYVVQAFAVHLGNSISAGHYRALLHNAQNGALHYCDDQVKPVLLGSFDHVAGDVYCIFLSRA